MTETKIGKYRLRVDTPSGYGLDVEFDDRSKFEECIDALNRAIKHEGAAEIVLAKMAVKLVSEAEI